MVLPDESFRVPVDLVVGKLAGGMSAEEVAKDKALKPVATQALRQIQLAPEVRGERHTRPPNL